MDKCGHCPVSQLVLSFSGWHIKILAGIAIMTALLSFNVTIAKIGFFIVKGVQHCSALLLSRLVVYYRHHQNPKTSKVCGHRHLEINRFAFKSGCGVQVVKPKGFLALRSLCSSTDGSFICVQ